MLVARIALRYAEFEWPAWAALGVRLLPAMLPVRGDVLARPIEVDVLIDVIDPRHRNEMMMLTVG